MISHRTSTPRPTGDERAFFEALVAMRERYALDAAAEPRELISVRHAIAAANAEMRREIAPPRHIHRLGIEAN